MLYEVITKSGEHEVSLQTALAVMQAFDYEKYELLPFYITKQGEWRVGSNQSAPFTTLEQLKLESDAGDTSRITSYNVCYTKLLRSILRPRREGLNRRLTRSKRKPISPKQNGRVLLHNRLSLLSLLFLLV